jgi:hypothetical protein
MRLFRKTAFVRDPDRTIRVGADACAIVRKKTVRRGEVPEMSTVVAKNAIAF